MIDNFDLISPLLKFDNEDEFYFVQVLQRNKENPELGSNNRLVKAYYVYSLVQLNKYKEEMISLAKLFNARIYIHLNRRNARMVALEMMEDLAHSIKSNQFYLGKIYSSVCGRNHSEKDKIWVLDIDNPKYMVEAINPQIDSIIGDLIKIEPFGADKFVAVIPTKNGVHLITKAFNTQKFKDLYPDVKIHKNNPSILFVP